MNPHLLLFAGAALISLSPVWVQLVDVSPTVSGFYRVLFGGLALAIMMLVTRQSPKLPKRVLGILLVGALFFAADLWFWHRSIQYVGPGLATLLGNFQVFFMTLAGIFWLGQVPRPLQWIAVPLAIVGLALLVGFEWQALTNEYRAGVIFGLLTAVAYTGYMLSLRTARADAQHPVPSREMVVVSLATALLLAMIIVIEGESFSIPSVADVGWLAGYGILSHCIGWLLIASSLPKVTATEAGLALLLQPALSYVWEVLLFNRSFTVLEISGAIVTLFAIYLGSRH